ncbi:hypothetical protein ABZT48_47440 [Streptomyces avermitilis]|uniref:hypothetical protein n=1 Tax=Streptomyces avermitilis TaxID=33903 RepID=UPI0033B1A06B
MLARPAAHDALLVLQPEPVQLTAGRHPDVPREPHGGLWLHHTLRITETDGASDVLTLIVPCTCGRGYVDITLDTEDVLMEVLAELRPTNGRSPFIDCLLDCASVKTARTSAAASALDGSRPRDGRSIGKGAVGRPGHF